jgi:arylsulfatase A-like enzyme
LHLTDNTVVVFFSDNGGFGGVTAQRPLRGGKGTFYEGGIRVPLFIRWPGVTQPGTSTTTSVIGVDFYPSLLEIAGVKKPLNTDVDGQSFVSLLQGKKTFSREAIYWNFPGYLENGGKNKVVTGDFRTRPVSVVRSGDFKLLYFYEDQRVELYNIKEEIGEKTNLAESNPKKFKELKNKLQEWKKAVNAPEAVELNKSYNGAKNQDVVF